MVQPPTAKTSLSRLLRRILSAASLAWLATLLDLWYGLRRLAASLQEEGLYEFLVYDATLELRDAKGRTAVFHKHQRV